MQRRKRVKLTATAATNAEAAMALITPTLGSEERKREEGGREREKRGE